MARLLHLELLAASPAVEERVMVIEFYVPKNFWNAVIEFSSQGKKSLPTRPAGGVLGWLLAARESNNTVGSESSSHPEVA